MLRPAPGANGHMQVSLSRPHKVVYVHRLVLIAFVGPPPDGMEVCHNDGDPTNNVLSNLRWDTRTGNMRDAVDHRTHVNARKSHCKRGHLLREPNLIPSVTKRSGHRGCLACNRAQGRERYLLSRGVAVDKQAMSDAYFAEIMKGESGMSLPEMGDLRPEHRALILKAFIGEAEKAVADIVKQIKPSYPSPTTVPFESPLDGALLGTINRARTAASWKVDSLDQLTEYFAREFPDAMETVYLLAVPGQDEPVVLPETNPIAQALMQVAPDLLTPQRRVPPEVVEAALQESRDKGKAAAPGIQLIRPKVGNLSLTYDKAEAMPAIGRLVAAGRVSWSELVPGSALTALPAAERRAS